MREIDRHSLGRHVDEAFSLLKVPGRSLEEKAKERPARDGLNHVRVEQPFVQPLPLSEVGHALDPVVVVGDEDDESGMVLLLPVQVEGEIERRPAATESRRDHASKRDDAVSRLPFRIVDEAGVEAERDVVQEETLGDCSDIDSALDAVKRRQRAEGVVAVETEVPREVVARAERDADERDVAFERHPCDGSQRAVAAGDPENFRIRFPSLLSRILTLLEDVDVDSTTGRFLPEILRRRPAVARAGIDEQKA
jgi:hypothetical protein